MGVALICGDVTGARLCRLAFPIGAGLVVASTEFLGPNEERGWELAGKAVPALDVSGRCGSWL